jgi:hypothetical protein
MIYYYELKNGSGKINAKNDIVAITSITQRFQDLLCIYKESDTEDGTPFIIIYSVAHTIATDEILSFKPE